MKFILSFLFIILSTISFSAKLTMDVGGTYKFHGTYQVDEKNLFTLNDSISSDLELNNIIIDSRVLCFSLESLLP